MKTLAVCLMLIFMTSCTTVVSSDCAWVRQIVVNDGDEITRPTAEQIVAHNRKVAEFCR
jgi:hypothetical protein